MAWMNNEGAGEIPDEITEEGYRKRPIESTGDGSSRADTAYADHRHPNKEPDGPKPNDGIYLDG